MNKMNKFSQRLKNTSMMVFLMLLLVNVSATSSFAEDVTAPDSASTSIASVVSDFIEAFMTNAHEMKKSLMANAHEMKKS